MKSAMIFQEKKKKLRPIYKDVFAFFTLHILKGKRNYFDKFSKENIYLC